MFFERNFSMSMLNDFYEFTMSNGYFLKGKADQIVYFDMFFRNIPDGGGFAIAAGLEQVIEYLQGLKFTKEDIEFLRSKKTFDEKFLNYLENFEFKCDVWAVPEGMPIFPREPIVTVRGPAVQAQLVETMLLLTVNHQSLIATKANRIVRAAEGRAVSEFGSRRAQGYAGAVLGARAAYIAGCVGSSNVLTDMLYHVPSGGTMAHSWVQTFDSEYEAFCAYAEIYPDNCVLLIDTYNVLKSGLPNAIKTFDTVLKPKGYRPAGIRIDSGDITYLTKKIRRQLDEAGYPDCKIMVSNSLDEYMIREMILQGAQVDSFGVGERLITSKSEPVFGGVYKLAAVEKNGEIIPKIKISENTEKITNPHFKKVYRLYSKESGKAIADVVTLFDETIDESKPFLLFDPVHTWKKKLVENFTAVEIRRQIFKEGKLVYQIPSIEESRAFCAAEVENLWDEVKRFENPHRYYVDLSEKLWKIKQDLLSSDKN